MRLALTVLLPLLIASVSLGAYRFARVNGYSMHPAITHGEAIVYADHFDFAHLQAGDVVIYRNGTEVVCHRLVKRYGDRWKAKGDNNRFTDRGFMTRENFIGRVIYIEGNRI